MQGFDKLIDDLEKSVEKDDHLNDPLPATEVRKSQKLEEEKEKILQKSKIKTSRESSLQVPGETVERTATKKKKKVPRAETASEFIKFH